MNKMEESLSRLGYHFYIEKNGYEVFSNLTNDDKYAAASVAGEAVAHAKTLTASSYDISVIKNTFHHGEYTFCIVAVHTGTTDENVIAYIKQYIFLYILSIFCSLIYHTILLELHNPLILKTLSLFLCLIYQIH